MIISAFSARPESVSSFSVIDLMLYLFKLFFESGVHSSILLFSSNAYLPLTVMRLFTAHSYSMFFLKVQLIDCNNAFNCSALVESVADKNLVPGGTIFSTSIQSHFLVSNNTVLFLQELKKISVQKNSRTKNNFFIAKKLIHSTDIST